MWVFGIRTLVVVTAAQKALYLLSHLPSPWHTVFMQPGHSAYTGSLEERGKGRTPETDKQGVRISEDLSSHILTNGPLGTLTSFTNPLHKSALFAGFCKRPKLGDENSYETLLDYHSGSLPNKARGFYSRACGQSPWGGVADTTRILSML